jgi:phosphodiesterase/alkaline phosphatase D-like protein
MKYEQKCNLGEEQKAWLKREIESSTAEYTIIGAGV